MTDKEQLFHDCALEAFVAIAAETGDWPESEPTKRLAYRLYEEALCERK